MVKYISAYIVSFFASSPVWAQVDQTVFDQATQIDMADPMAYVPEETKSGLPQFDITTFPSQIFWLCIAFLFLYVFFARKVLPDISSVIERRKQLVESNLEEAEKLKLQAEDVKRKYTDFVELKKNEAALLIQEAKKDAEAETLQALEGFRSFSEKEISHAVNKIEAEKQAIYDDLDKIAADIVTQSVQKVAGLKISEPEARQAIESQTEQRARAA